MHPRNARTLVRTLALAPLALLAAGCDRHSSPPATPAAASDAAAPSTPTLTSEARHAPPTAPPPADRVAVRQVATFYRWASTEPGDQTTGDQSIEHGTPQLHLVYEVHHDPQNRGWITVGALGGGVLVPENKRMRPLASSATWHAPAEGHTEFSLEQFGGQVRGDEPITVFLASAPGERATLHAADAPAFVRLPASDTLPATQLAATGQYDAIVVALVPVSNRHGGRYLVYALDLLAQPGGFSADGVMSHLPTAQEIERYVRWMRDRNGMGRDRNPPIAMSPIDRS